MKHICKIIMPVMIVLAGCTGENIKYELPSAEAKSKPAWVGQHRAARDTIFVVVQIERHDRENLQDQVQEAQSVLHGILVNELDPIIREYWEQKGIELSDDDEFSLLAGLPQTLESVMKHVDVVDGWEDDQTRSYLCALDYANVAQEIMSDLRIEDVAFRSYLKRRMDQLAKKYH